MPVRLLALIAIAILVPSVCFANAEYGNRAVIDLDVMAVGWNKAEVENSSVKTTGLGLGNVGANLSIGYSLMPLLVIGSEFGLRYRHIETPGDDTTDVVEMAVIPFVQLNIWASDKVLIPLRVGGGFVGGFADDSRIYAGAVRVKPALHFLVSESLSLGPYFIMEFTKGKIEYDDDAFDGEKLGYSTLTIGGGLGLTFWI